MKTFQEFITEAKKCWSGYKKKGTQKLFGKTYNNCVKDVEEDYKKLPRERMQQQYDRKKDKNYDEFHKQNTMGDGPRVLRGRSDNEIDKHGNSKQTKAISGQLKNNPRFYDDSHEMWQRMQSKYKSNKNSNATSEVGKRLTSSVDEDLSVELEESSTGERSRGRATLARGRGADMTKSERTTASVAKKAGLKGTGKYSTKDLRKKARDYTTYDSEDDEDDIGSTEQDHFIRTYSSARRAAKGERLISKMKPAGRTPSGMTKLKSAPSGESVRRVKDLKKQMTKSGASKTGRVHTVDIMHRDSDVGKGDRNQQMERGRNFIQAVKDTPKHLEKAGAKKGDTVIGKPTAVMPGEDKKTGEAKRAKLYGKIFGKKSTKASPKTGLMTGKVS
jgi:hypothetical protein